MYYDQMSVQNMQQQHIATVTQVLGLSLWSILPTQINFNLSMHK